MKKRKSPLKIIIFALLLVFGLSGCQNQTTEKSRVGENVQIPDHLPAAVKKIVQKGYITVGVKEDVPGFGYMNPDTNQNEGMEPDIARLIAKALTGSPDNVKFVGVTAKTRGPLLDNGEIDMVIATFTINEERKKTYNFTEPYFQDKIGFLVRTASQFENIGDLDGKTIGVAKAATTKDAVEKYGAEHGWSFEFRKFGTYPELKAALVAGRIDAFCVDQSILRGYVDDKTEILGEGFSPQVYGIATKKSNTELNEYLNQQITTWSNDGTLTKIFEKWDLTQ